MSSSRNINRESQEEPVSVEKGWPEGPLISQQTGDLHKGAALSLPPSRQCALEVTQHPCEHSLEVLWKLTWKLQMAHTHTCVCSKSRKPPCGRSAPCLGPYHHCLSRAQILESPVIYQVVKNIISFNYFAQKVSNFLWVFILFQSIF